MDAMHAASAASERPCAGEVLARPRPPGAPCVSLCVHLPTNPIAPQTAQPGPGDLRLGPDNNTLTLTGPRQPPSPRPLPWTWPYAGEISVLHLRTGLNNNTLALTGPPSSVREWGEGLPEGLRHLAEQEAWVRA